MPRPKPTSGVTRMNINLKTELHTAFKAITALQEKQMTDVVVAFIEKYVRENQPEGWTPQQNKK